VRIIAGKHRGRLLSVPSVDGLRPTGARVRETLFNWLQMPVQGAHCLDLFAGSGALGFEALSRGAAAVVFVEPDAAAYQAINESCASLKLPYTPVEMAGPDGASSATGARLFNGSAEQWLQRATRNGDTRRFDIVFIDPPFRTACQWQMLDALAPFHLNESALVYLEFPASQAPAETLHGGFSVIKEKTFGDVCIQLLCYQGRDV